MGPLEGVGGVVAVGALVHVQHLDVHRHGHGALVLDPVPEAVPAEEGRGVGDLPHGLAKALDGKRISSLNVMDNKEMAHGDDTNSGFIGQKFRVIDKP